MISDSQYRQAAALLDVDEAAIRAVVEVESRGHAMLPDGRPVVLFESHKFSDFTGGQWDDTYPHISSARWNRSLYAKGRDWIERGEREHDRLDEAASLNRRAALESASYGLFQVMGFNWGVCGYDSLDAFLADMWRGPEGHLAAFIGFVQHERLDGYLRRGEWGKFSARYNGPAYKLNRYDVRLAEAYVRHKEALRRPGPYESKYTNGLKRMEPLPPERFQSAIDEAVSMQRPPQPPDSLKLSPYRKP